MAYAFDLKQACGGYAYFSTFTHGHPGRSVHEIREPSLVIEMKFHAALAEIGQFAMQISSDEQYRSWLHLHGWAIVNVDFARKSMPQWLQKHRCLKSALGSFVDVSIASPATLKRTLRGQQKRKILERDGNQCLRCNARERLTLQHIQPYTHGGETNSSNLVSLCDRCNQDLKDEIHSELYELAGLRSGVEPSLLKSADDSQTALSRAVYFSHNLMHTRCALW